jgi:hypothetical protein
MVKSGLEDTYTDAEVKEIYDSTHSITSDFPGIDIDKNRDQILNTYNDNDVLDYSRRINNGDSHEFNI